MRLKEYESDKIPIGPWYAYNRAIDELISLLDGLQPELEFRIRNLLVDKPKKLVRIVLKPAIAGSAAKSSIGFEPSNLLLNLIVAVRANDADNIRIIEHDIRS